VPLSPGAILARELGVPCVINSRIGTAVLRTGDLLRVDGDGGRVEVLERGSS
jgi:phosphoenolpyruvate-protein kinase (PTS system EI component)